MKTIKPLSRLKKSIKIASDKSISHRAAIFSAITSGTTEIKSFLKSDDTSATLSCLRKAGIGCNFRKDSLYVKGKGMFFPKKKQVILFARESGTTIRILTGLLVGQKTRFLFTAAPSLNRRPMARIINPLNEMGAKIKGNNRLVKPGTREVYPPLKINPGFGCLKGKKHNFKIASAQVKSAVLLAGLYASGKTTVVEPFASRDHTERMLKAFGADLKICKNKATLSPGKPLKSPKQILVPSDFSSAAFFLVLGLILKNSQITLKKVNINPTRSGLLAVLKKMGAKIEIKNKKSKIEPYADIIVKSSQLKAVSVKRQQIPAMIDEIPILCVAAAFAKGKTVIEGVQELVYKETNRIHSMVSNLTQAGVKIKSSRVNQRVSITIDGANNYYGAKFKSYRDHRTAMSLVIFSLAAKSPSTIDNLSCIKKSFPDFIKIVNSFYNENKNS